MNQNIKEAVFRPILNTAEQKPFRLKLNLSKIRTGLQLKSKVADYLNHFPECIILEDDATGKMIQDITDLSKLAIGNKHSFSLIVTRRNYKPPINVERLIVGGIDLTKIKQMAPFLNKNKYQQYRQCPQQRRIESEEQRTMNRIPTQFQRQSQRIGNLQESMQTDLRIKYKTQLLKVRQLECIKDENQILAILEQFNGDIDNALHLLFSQ